MANDFYLKLDGIDSELEIKNREKWIPILGFSYGVEGLHRGGDSGDQFSKGSTHFTGLTIIKEIDETTPLLHGALITNARLKTGRLELLKATATGMAQVYMVYDMKAVFVTKITQLAKMNDSKTLPLEEIVLGMESIEWIATPYNRGGQAGAARKYFWRLFSPVT